MEALDNVQHASSEASISMSGGGTHDEVANKRTSLGRWYIERSIAVPMLVGYDSRGANRVANAVFLKES